MSDRISLQRLSLLQSLGRIARVVTNHKGYINRAYLLPMAGDHTPKSPFDYVGTKYSFRQHLPGGHVAYRLRCLGDRAFGSEINLAPDEVRPIFLRVLLDCLTPARVPGEVSGAHGRHADSDATRANVGAKGGQSGGSAPRILGPETSRLGGRYRMPLPD